jgi:hypothetical protein
MSDKQVSISVGAMSPKLSVQLSSQGFCIDNVGLYEKNLDAATRLLICGYIPQSVANKCRDKILKQVFKKMRPI